MTIKLDEAASPEAMCFGRRLKAQRRAMKLSQVQLYERTGVTPGYISAIEQGHSNPSLEMMVKLAEAVGLELWAMLRPDSSTDALA